MMATLEAPAQGRRFRWETATEKDNGGRDGWDYFSLSGLLLPLNVYSPSASSCELFNSMPGIGKLSM